MNKKNIAVFASGSGTNAENIVRYFSATDSASVTLILSNNPKAYVLKRAELLNVETYVFDREQFYSTPQVINLLKEHKTDLIVLAGFLWLIPANFIHEFKNKIVNIHPALLPKYGGKGMYGMYVHQAVISNGEKESGISIHYVNEHYDDGNIIFQAACPVAIDDSPETLAEKIHHLEYKYYPLVIEDIIKGRKVSVRK